MTYEIYKQKLSKEQFFATWESEQFSNLTKAIQDRIYTKHLVKAEVLTRDSFQCQNIHCTYPDSPLTMHHVKAKRNGGKDKPRHCVTLCDTCHKAYERAKKAITFAKDAMHLPSNMRGHTFKLSKISEVDWKQIKKKMKTLRKNLKSECGLDISWEQVRILMMFLELDYAS